MGVIFEGLLTSFDSIKDELFNGLVQILPLAILIFAAWQAIKVIIDIVECIVYAANKDTGPMGDNPYDNHPWF